MKKGLLLLAVLLVFTNSFAQSKRIDSLWISLKKHPQSDTFRVNRLNELTSEWGLAFHQYDSVAKEALVLARKLNYKIGQAKALFTRGMVQYSINRNNLAAQDKVKEAQQWLDEAIRLAEQAADKPLTISMLTQLAASKRFSNSEKKQAVLYDRRALKLSEALADKKRISDCQRMIALDYEQADGNYAAALLWNMKSLEMAKQINNPEAQIYPLRAIGGNYTSLNNFDDALANLTHALTISRTLSGESINEFQYYILSSIGQLYTKLGQYKAALQSYEEALTVRKRDYPATTAAVFDNPLAAIYEAQGQYSLAIAHGVRGLAKAEQDRNNWGEVELSTTLAEAYLHTNRLDSAQYYANQAFTIAQTTHQKELIRDASQVLSDVYAKQKKFAEAYQYQGIYHTYRDSLNNEDVTRKATATQFSSQIKEQRSQIKLLTKEKQLQAQVVSQQRFQRNAIIIGCIMLLILAGAIAAYLLNRARLRRLEEAQQLRQQIAQDLHDEVGSTLSSISLLSEMSNKLLEQNQPETAQRMVQKIYTDARQILEAIDEIIWTINPGNDSLQRISQRLKEYAQPLMESKNIVFSFDIDPELELLPISMEIRRNVYLIGKEAINNLVKYSAATQATVRFSRLKDQLTVQIEDNGCGFDTEQVHTRNGQQSMRQRAKAMDGQLVVESSPNQGTRLQLSLPLI